MTTKFTHLGAALLGAGLAAGLVLPGWVGIDGATPFVQLAALTPMVLVVILGGAFVGRLAGALVSSLSRRRRPPLDERHPRLFSLAFAAMVGAAVVVLTAAAIVGPRLLADDLPAPPLDSRPLTVLSLNVDKGGADVAALATLVRDRRPDLVVLPEAGDPFRLRLLAALPGYRGVSAESDDADSTTLLAAPQVPDAAVTTIPGALFGSLVVTLPGGLRVTAVHLAAPVPGQVQGWHDDLARLVAPSCAGVAAGPVVVVGDFNATTDQSAFREASSGCTDALPAVGAGTTATYPSSYPRGFGLQIDHVLAGGGVTVQGGEVLDVPGTDHRAVLVRLALPSG